MKHLAIHEIYKFVQRDILHEKPGTILESTELITQSCVHISKKDLLSLNDAEFAKSLYFKILDRAPRQADVKSLTSRLKLGLTTREKELDRFLSSEENKIKNVRVEVR